MQIVIDVPEYIYKLCQGHGDIVYKYIANGTPLPKGHGRLIDENDLMPDSDYDDGEYFAVSIGAIKGAQTIIEADIESEEE